MSLKLYYISDQLVYLLNSGMRIFIIPFLFLTYGFTLTVEIKDLRSKEGTVKYLLFKGEDGYPDESDKSVRQGSVSADVKKIKLTGLEKGKYVMTMIHDENDNGKLDTTLGIPKEGFGFSQNPSIYFGPPSFKRARFVFPETERIKIKMKYM